MKFKVSGIQEFGQMVEIPDNLLQPADPQLVGRLVDAAIGRLEAASRRERIATAVLAGLCAKSEPGDDFAIMAKASVALANVLIAELDKGEK